jgi:predicted GNAT family N-acyltransferase
MHVTINKITSPEELQECLRLRFLVFVEGQKVPLDEELDDKDAESDHYLLRVDGEAAGVTRVRFVADYAKIERVAIHDSFQNKGLGRQLMDAVLRDIKKLPLLKKARLSSQTQAIPFYERLGFRICSDEYMDAGIPHKDMELLINTHL